MNNDDNFTRNSGDGGELSPELEARVVAWVLGEASAFEAAQLEALCAEQPELAVFKRRIQAVHGLTGEAMKPLKTPLLLSPERRAKVLAVIGGEVPTVESVVAAPKKARKKTRSWQGWVMPMAACLALMGLLAAVIIPTTGRVRETSRRSVELSDARQREQMALIERMEGESDTTVGLDMPTSGTSAVLEMPDLPSRGAGSGTGLGGFGAGMAPSPATAAPKPMPVVPQTNSYADSRANGLMDRNSSSLSVTVDTNYPSDYVYRAADGFAPAPTVTTGPVAKEKQNNSIRITAGVPQEFTVREAPAKALWADQSQLMANVDPFAPPPAPALEGRYALRASGVSFDDQKLDRQQVSVSMIEEISNAWQRPSGRLAENEESQVFASGIPDANESARRRFESTIVPKVNFNGVRLSRVLTILTSVSEEYDTAKGGKPLDIKLEGSVANEPSVNITLRNLSMKRILDIITESVGYTYEMRGNTVVVRPPAPPPAPPPVDDLRAETATAEQAVSTFSLHVSDASFRVAQAALARGIVPDASTIRPEEFYNAFDYGDPAPVAGEAVACRIEQAAHPFLQQRNLVRIAMKVPAAGRSAAQPLRLTVLLDTSGSMEREDRAATVRAALGSLASLLGPADRVTLIGFARTPRLLAVDLPGDQAARLIEIAAQTPAEGGTNLEEALRLAGDQARAFLLPAAQNRIVLLTDGAANLGDADPARLSERVEALRREGIAFDACGVVADGLDDGVLEALTRKGDGRYTIINSPEEADAGFARQLAGAFRPAAKDVKVQVVFNPARVSSYRLIGFEQHRLRTEDFRDNKIDAAELAAEEAANALYQVAVIPDGEGELGEVFVRFLDPSTGVYVERSWVLGYDARATVFARATPSIQLAGSAAFLAEKLRGGALAGQVRLDEFAPIIEGLGAAFPQAARVQEFIQMFRQTRRMTGE